MIVIHYSEIGTKGENRAFFENQLVKNVEKVLDCRVYKRYGKIIAETDKADLRLIPGVAYYAVAVKTKLELEDIKKNCLKLLKGKKFDSFRVTSSRSNKNFKLTSQELNEKLGEFIIKKLKKKVKLKNPDKTVYVEIGEKEAFIYLEKINGVGGLPVGVSGKVIGSLSGGLDSPVASYLMMKRGCEVIFVHVYNDTLMKKGMETKLKKLVEELTRVQLKSKLYLVGFGDIQKEIIDNIPTEFRMIVYRRFMMGIINEIVKKEKAKGVVTGDSVGQVASQTLENLNCIYDASESPVFAPLIGLNKNEIIEISKRINTYEHSIMPYPDCCSYMIAKHPCTKASLAKIKNIEKEIEHKDELVKKSISGAKVLKI